MELRKDFTFEASHILPRHKGKCSRLHGHSWKLTVCVEGPVEHETGFVQDYAEISEFVKPLIERLDHRHLGAWEIKGEWIPMIGEGNVEGLSKDFYPTSENLILWIGEQLHRYINWSTLILNETCTSSCILTRAEFIRLRKKKAFSA